MAKLTARRTRRTCHNLPACPGRGFERTARPTPHRGRRCIVQAWTCAGCGMFSCRSSSSSRRVGESASRDYLRTQESQVTQVTQGMRGMRRATPPPPTRVAIPAGTGRRFGARRGQAPHLCNQRRGALYCWGEGGSGRLGQGDESTLQVPTLVGAGRVWSFVTAGEEHTCAIDEAGELFCWGGNPEGQLGFGRHFTSADPHSGLIRRRLDPAPPRPRTITSAPSSTKARSSVGERTSSDNSGSTSRLSRLTELHRRRSAFCETGCAPPPAKGTPSRCATTCSSAWDETRAPSSGLGSETPGQAAAPTMVLGSWSRVAAGQNYSCGIRTDGSLWCWGGRRNEARHGRRPRSPESCDDFRPGPAFLK